uniref:Uncharacterized protein n=1 Tax=Geospiza parvula TaxID=87175 RepID=A0A8C3QAG0_GEOPR
MALELVEGGGRGLVEEQGHGARLVGLGDQHGVAAQHHRLVLHLVPVHPGEHLGVPAVGGAVGDAVQQVRVARGPRRPAPHPHAAARPPAPKHTGVRGNSLISHPGGGMILGGSDDGFWHGNDKKVGVFPPNQYVSQGCVPGFADHAGLLAFFPPNLPFAPVISKPVRSPCCSSPFGLSWLLTCCFYLWPRP